jgi:hypothetical protein
MPNKWYAEKGLKQGLGTSGSGARESAGQPAKTSAPERTADWPGLPGKAQSRTRTTEGWKGPFYVKKAGL